jgi:hypothetical protein
MLNIAIAVCCVWLVVAMWIGAPDFVWKPAASGFLISHAFGAVGDFLKARYSDEALGVRR